MSICSNKLAIFTLTLSLGNIASLVFADSVKAFAFADVSEIGDYTQIYQLDIVESSFGSSGTPAYNTDNSGTVFPSGIDRIGYYLELESGGNREWVWASMDAFTQDLSLIGVPTFSSGASWEQTVSNMNIESNVAGITTGTGITTGNIEFWPNDYGTTNNSAGVPGANGGVYDFGDDMNSTNPGYGSMQVHNYGANQTLLAYNSWGAGSGGVFVDDLGIGNNSGTNPDWTFASNIGDYSVRNLEVFVQPNAAVTVPFNTSPTLAWITLGGIFGISRLRKNYLLRK